MYKGERFNSISHLLGAITALAGLVIVVVMAARQGDPWKIVSLRACRKTGAMKFNI